MPNIISGFIRFVDPEDLVVDTTMILCLLKLEILHNFDLHGVYFKKRTDTHIRLVTSLIFFPGDGINYGINYGSGEAGGGGLLKD